ncbi:MULTISPECIES: hypothetical protein [unclassified Paracoccus (in: a-proteobacteria)]|uniref:hypothetical protein n=1 Tax=unclassified Paracoccus (in: a-proteobacteria) TaxID=2688777 RepID=UPI0015FF507B|nr:MULTISPECIES: hypothetical protein [unclassified Paracoccus (in: a-proteobacteria)]MBB1493321.1 hypothetical protein [Paracoccus sp. MC1854]MBB1499764.1 hypothetical protein [Paracoccus sp. MC1862]QQO45320.1 hypothetical protein JGR78_02850 [Paracoccus sp. MC1862]
MVMLPLYATLWMALGAVRQSRNLASALVEYGSDVGRALAGMASELTVFASAGIMVVLIHQLLPGGSQMVAAMGWGPDAVAAVPLMMAALFLLSCVGINPIIVTAILASTMAGLAIPDLSQTAIALSLAGAWASVMIFSPSLTLVALASGLPAVR